MPLCHNKKGPSLKKCHWSLKVFLCLVLLLVVERLCHRATEGFQVNFIKTPSRITSFEKEVANLPLSKEMRNLLMQPFYFLGSGAQCYAFISEDGSYVLKVFKQHNFFIPSFLTTWPLPPFLQKFCQDLIQAQQIKRESFMRSCVIAATSWKEETGMLYLHLAPSLDTDFSVTLVDKLNIAHRIPAHTLQFAIQKRAELVTPTLSRLLQKGHLQEAEACIHSLMHLIQTRCQKGIGDRDPVVRRNFGFIEGKAVEIDIGSYFDNPFLKTDPLYTRDLYFEIRNLQGWLHNHHPELAHIPAEALKTMHQF